MSKNKIQGSKYLQLKSISIL